MQFLNCYALLALAASLLGIKAEPDATIKSDDVVVLSSTDTFKKFVEGSKASLVEFYAPWCGHCKHLAPQFSEAAGRLKKDGIMLAQVDCTAHQDLCQGVSGYPTLRVYTSANTNYTEYRGARSAEDIVKQIQPEVTAVTAENASEFVKKDSLVAVSFFPPGSAEEKEFAKVARRFRNQYSFGAIKGPSVVLFKNFDEGYAVYDTPGKITEESLTEFIQRESLPLMAEISQTNFMHYFDSKLPLAYLFYADSEQRAKYGPAIESVLREFKGKLNAVYIDAVKYNEHAETMNVPAERPALFVHSFEKNYKYPFTGGVEKLLDAQEVKGFFKGVLDGQIKPTFKSEKIPEKEEGHVKTLVHENFDKIVFESKKDVLVEFYAPWCGHCKTLAPVYEKLAEKYKKTVKGGDQLIIAKMNAIDNDLPPSLDFELRGFPTIKLFKAGKGAEPIDYDGDRSLKSMVEFLNENSSVKGAALDKKELAEEEERRKKIQEAREAREKARKQSEAEKAAAGSSDKGSKASSQEEDLKQEL